MSIAMDIINKSKAGAGTPQSGISTQPSSTGGIASQIIKKSGANYIQSQPEPTPTPVASKPGVFQQISNTVQPLIAKAKTYFSPTLVSPNVDYKNSPIKLPESGNLLKLTDPQTSGSSAVVIPGQEKELTQKLPKRIAQNLGVSALQGLKSMTDFAQWATTTASKNKTVSKGNSLLGEPVRKGSEKASVKLQEWSDKIAPENPQFADKLIQGVGSTIPFFIAGVGTSSLAQGLLKMSPKVAGLFGAGVSGFLEAGTEAGGVYDENRKAGKSISESSDLASKTFLANMAVNVVTDKLGFLEESAKNKLKKIFVSGGMEGFQEMVQQITSNLNTGKKWSDGVIESGVIGSIVGGGLTGGLTQVDPEIKAIVEKLQNAKAKETVIEPGVYTPEEIRSKVIDGPLENTAEGKELIKASVQADIAGQSIEISKEGSSITETDSTPTDTKVELKEETKPVKVEEEKKTLEPKYNNQEEFTKTLKDAKPADNMKVYDLYKTLETKQDEVFMDRVEEYKKLIQEGKAIDPIVVNPQGEVLDGGHRLTAMKELGIETAETVVVGQSAPQVVEGTKLYRGSTDEKMLTGRGRGVSFATSKDVAERFSKSDFTGFNYEGGKVGEFVLPKDAKILDASKLTANQIKGSLDRENIFNYAKNNGYDAIDFSKQIDPLLIKSGRLPENEIRVINTSILKPVAPQGVEKTKVPESKKADNTDKNHIVDDNKKADNTSSKGIEHPKGTGKKKVSRLYKRVRDTLGAEYASKEIKYDELSLKKQSQAVVNMIENNPEKAVQIARGEIEPPQGTTQNAFAVGLASVAQSKGDFKMASELWTKTSLRSTRLGQEIVSLRGSMGVNEPLNAIRRVVNERMESVAKKYKNIIKALNLPEGTSTAKAVDELVKVEAKKLEKIVKAKQAKIQSAQEIINSLIC